MAEQKISVLVIDDDPALLKLMKRTLELEGYEVTTAGDGETGLQFIQEREPSLVLLDIMMPGLDGYQVIQAAREIGEMPIVMLTAKDRPQDVVKAIDLGVDDYLTKPFNTEQLLDRVKRVLRRPKPKPMTEAISACGGLRIDFSSGQVILRGRLMTLTTEEHRAVCLLALNAGRAVTRNQLLNVIWGPGHAGKTGMLRSLIVGLREKMGDDPTTPKYIITKPGVGYLLGQDSKQAEPT